MLSASETVATAITTLADGKDERIVDLVRESVDSVRPIRAREVQPAWAKASAVAAPVPEPAPVMMTVLPAAESSGRVGEMAA